MNRAAASIVAQGCPRAHRSVLCVDAPAELQQELLRTGIELLKEPAAARSVGAALVACQVPLHPARLRSLRACLARRGRFYATCPDRLLPAILAALAQSGLHPKRLLLPADPRDHILVVAASGRPGGLVVQRLTPQAPEP